MLKIKTKFCGAGRKQGRRSAQTAEETKVHILIVAGKMFCDLGFEKVSLRNISEAAGVSHSLIRHHFGSKEQIWYAISDVLHGYIQRYIAALVAELPKDKPANVCLYQFGVKMLAHMLLTPQPIQFIADAVRQDGEFFDYFIDHTGHIEAIIGGLVDSHNQHYPDRPVLLPEMKWEVMLFAHGAASLKPLLNQIWVDKTSDPEQALLLHWQLYNQQQIAKLNIADNDVIQPASLQELLLPISCDFDDPNNLMQKGCPYS
jgi:AcrR family transcriptional regulator